MSGGTVLLLSACSYPCAPESRRNQLQSNLVPFTWHHPMTMDASSILRSAAPVEHLVKHEKPQISSEKPNLSKPGVHGQRKVGAAAGRIGSKLNYFLPVLPKLERREKNKTNVSSTESILDYILPPRADYFTNPEAKPVAPPASPTRMNHSKAGGHGRATAKVRPR
ncbi:hypothetical protein BV898_17746 [Hypsibius exemplaris]|uniref:Uncharacterized protein n=1 Tax=Hypsibius exemplaris TaxID=2072580 RepID=A0A9X6NIK0_HYPEX|nr:hypothetical protein BV898_17746 [Hypsibius exemplaris]